MHEMPDLAECVLGNSRKAADSAASLRSDVGMVLQVELALQEDQENEDDERADKDDVAVHLNARLGDGDTQSAKNLVHTTTFQRNWRRK